MISKFRTPVFIAAVFWCASLQPLCAASWTRASEVTVASDLGDKLIPHWTNGRLVTAEGENTARPIFRTYGPTGQLISSVVLAIPEASRVTVLGFASSPDGAIAVCGDAFQSDGRGAAYLAIFSANGGALHITRTSPYHPAKVAIASDDTVWTMGEEPADKNARVLNPRILLRPDTGAIRRYSLDGREIASFVPQGTLSSPADIVGEGNYLVSTTNGVAWYSTAGRRLVEISLSGKTIADIRVDGADGTLPTGFAVTERGGVFRGIWILNQKRWGFQELDKARQEWVTIGGGEGWGELLGAHGNMLVGRTSASRSTRSSLEFFSEQ